ncbi:hypothetical protein GH714_037019 [Hevea brasiliensis]|uniref:Aluminum-activated malate transporter n=1 Tax=Hevea brasiliensis TaxID=3981 RepID=A0A6A6LQY1_HEVBR|nr:hypothetical protein GH714_037019 [Hevea brasiliensis]
MQIAYPYLAMEVGSEFASGWTWFKTKVTDFGRCWKKLGKDDPRRVIHSLKVGLAIALVSIFYYYQPLYENFGVSAMWAVMTVVVVFEFSVGEFINLATLGKGLNRGVATLVAGALGVGAHHLAKLSGSVGEPTLLGFFVFLQAAITTFMRFFPKIKARYDYGLLIFILTFSLVSVSGFREDEILELAHRRLSTIIIGASACVIISILFFPVWAGEDLHNLIALNMEKLGNFSQGFADEYFRASEEDEASSSKDEKSFLEDYKSVLNSKNAEESLANFARWEPGHGQFRFRHPWKQYLKVGTLTRQCAYRIEALLAINVVAGIIGSQKQNPRGMHKNQHGIWESPKRIVNCSKNMRQSSSSDIHIENAKTAAKNLNSLLKSDPWEDNVDLLQVIPVVTVASLLIDLVNCIEELADSIYELASNAHFKKLDPTVSPEKPSATVKSPPKDDWHHVVINIDEAPTPAIREEENSSAPNTSIVKYIQV